MDEPKNKPRIGIDEMFDEHGQFIDIDAAFHCYKQPMQAASAEFADLLKNKQSRLPSHASSRSYEHFINC